MKKLVSIIFSLVLAVCFLSKSTPIFAACNGNGLCQTEKGCCSGYAKKVETWVCPSGWMCVKSTNPDAVPIYGPSNSPKPPNTCETLQDATAQKNCQACMKDNVHVWTAIGCIEVTSTGLLNKFIPFAIGIAGGIAFMLILFGAIQMMTSAGNPEKLNGGKELITAAIAGLLLIVFSVFILRLVGVTILQIPGFS